MATTILDALRNAEMNLNNLPKIGMFILPLIKNQLHNGITLLEKGYSIYTKIDPLLEQYNDNIESVPEKEL